MLKSISELKPHPLNAEIYGDGCNEELLNLIQKNGVKDEYALVITGDQAYCGANVIISGHRRFNAAQMAQISEVPVIISNKTTQEDIEELLVLGNVGSRERTIEQKAREYKALKRIEAARAEKRMLSGKKNPMANLPQGTSREFAAEKVGMKARTAEKAVKVINVIDKAKELGEQKIAQDITDTLNKSVDGAYKEVKTFACGLTVEQAKEQLQELHEKRRKREEQKQNRQNIAKSLETVSDVKVSNLAQVKTKYRIIYADPPWMYGNDQTKAMPGSTRPEDHYPVMSTDEICKLPVKSFVMDDAVLFLWGTSPLLEDALKVIKAWSFAYKTTFIWDKVKHNFGHYNSVRHEILFVATRGSCTPDNKTLYDSVQTIERTEHSKKPEYFREIIDDLYQYGNRIELFSRQPAKGWDSWGNEI